MNKSIDNADKLNECYFVSDKNTTSATICVNCGKEKMFHTIGEGIKVTKVIMFGIQADIFNKIIKNEINR